MKRLFLAPLAAFFLATLAPRAEDVDTSSRPDTVRGRLVPYSIGIGTGAAAALNSELQEEEDAFLKLSLVQELAFGDQYSMGMDVDWFGPGNNWGGSFTISYLLAQGPFRPFLGAGAGLHHFDKPGRDFGGNLGPSAMVHAGFLLNILEEMQMRVRVPVLFVANKDQDRTAGVDLAIIFSNPVRTKTVKKLLY